MRKQLIKPLITLAFLIFGSLGYSQEKIEITEEDYNNQEVEMADQLRADGKIYVLTGIILIVVVGMITYLVIIDKKVSRIEKQLPNNEA